MMAELSNIAGDSSRVVLRALFGAALTGRSEEGAPLSNRDRARLLRLVVRQLQALSVALTAEERDQPSDRPDVGLGCDRCGAPHGAHACPAWFLVPVWDDGVGRLEVRCHGCTPGGDDGWSIPLQGLTHLGAHLSAARDAFRGARRAPSEGPAPSVGAVEAEAEPNFADVQASDVPAVVDSLFEHLRHIRDVLAAHHTITQNAFGKVTERLGATDPLVEALRTSGPSIRLRLGERPSGALLALELGDGWRELAASFGRSVLTTWSAREEARARRAESVTAAVAQGIAFLLDRFDDGPPRAA